MTEQFLHLGYSTLKQSIKLRIQMETEMKLKELLFNSNQQIVSSISIKFTQFSSHH